MIVTEPPREGFLLVIDDQGSRVEVDVKTLELDPQTMVWALLCELASSREGG